MCNWAVLCICSPISHTEKLFYVLILFVFRILDNSFPFFSLLFVKDMLPNYMGDFVEKRHFSRIIPRGTDADSFFLFVYKADMIAVAL